MILVITSITLILIFVLIAIGIGFNREKTEKEAEEVDPIIHASGVYSIFKKSPREDLAKIRPNVEDIRKYLEGQSEICGVELTEADKGLLIEQWNKSISENIKIIEKGDLEGVDFYFYQYSSEECPICQKYSYKGRFVTRQEIFTYPGIIPPFHLGCTSCFHPHHGKENLRDTTELKMQPLFQDESFPALPDWKIINKPYVSRGTSA